MRRGDLYRVRRPAGDPQTVTSVRRREPPSSPSIGIGAHDRPEYALIDSRFSIVVCAPVYTRRDGLATQVDLGPEEGLKHESSIHFDALVSLPKSLLTDFVASLHPKRLRALDAAVRIALGLA